MYHDPLHHQHILAYVEELSLTRSRRLQHPGPVRSRARPGRLRRAVAAALLHLAERLARQPATTTPHRT